MTEMEYIQKLEDVLKQYKDGAINACEVVNRVYLDSNNASTTDWWTNQWNEIENSIEDEDDDYIIFKVIEEV